MEACASVEHSLDHSSGALSSLVHTLQLCSAARQAVQAHIDGTEPQATRPESSQPGSPPTACSSSQQSPDLHLDGNECSTPVPDSDDDLKPLTNDGTDPSIWSETARLHLHFVLLKQLRKLRYDATPLADVIDLVQWLSSKDAEDIPFSFSRCVLVAKLFPSLMDDTSFEGLLGLDVDAAAEAIRVTLRPYIARKLERLPLWAQRLVRVNPGFVVEQLAHNPQWLNEQVIAYPYFPLLDQRQLLAEPGEARSILYRNRFVHGAIHAAEKALRAGQTSLF